MGKASAVIKAGSLPRQESAGLRKLNLQDVRAEAQAMIDDARKRADEFLQIARAEAEQVKEQARKQGYEAGFEQGRQAGEQSGYDEAFNKAREQFAQQQENLVSSFQNAIDAVNADREAWQAAARQDLVELAMAIARRVVGHVGEQEKETVLANLEKTVQLIGARSNVTVTVNPADAEAAKLFARSLVEMREQWQSIEVVEETDISPGGCRICWGDGSADATLETQLDRIAHELKANAARRTEE
jgi:flagellar assembly protein FliH